ncbi:phosphopantothenoylcysteine decarboxylase [Diabrotica virgifera virgifera]|uniref:Phosphopantothenoylcysteine decarboxylase n=1 Tax=Diabrotica virgifera virgifera TaxID=50390 RepID=A0A6P7FJ76_DIAVI|nr:phosphopantothenoylcysteine decarboxylase [Diabrotica virgifera virgifera]
MVKILVCCTGSVAAIKLPQLLRQLKTDIVGTDSVVRVCLTESARHFLKNETFEDETIFVDSDEWEAWTVRGDPVLHIELAKWADLLLIAPLDANTLAKISNGICDNLLTCAVRAWDLSKPLVFCPAMNTKMYEHPLTAKQIEILKSFGYYEVPVISKELMCGDVGPGAMAEVPTIVEFVKDILKKKNSS